MRAAVFIVALLLALPARAQTAEEVGQMRLYVQQLEEQVRRLTGENERLTHEVNQMRAQLGLPALGALPSQTGAVSAAPSAAPIAGRQGAPATGGQAALDPGSNYPAGAPPQDLGSASISPNDPLIAPDGAMPGGPIDLSVLAGGTSGAPLAPNGGMTTPADPTLGGGMQTAGIPAAPPPTTALSGSPRDEYDLAYGYILTGDYDLAETSFQNWIANFPSDPQVTDARFWLGESHFQQGEYKEAANAFLAVYKAAPQSVKGPDALLKLGMSLSALGEKDAACATLAEVGKKYPDASAALMSRVNEEAGRAGC
jgi:tol-pal system protein YbgF